MQGVRGPDAIGSMQAPDGSMKLFHQRLSIIDLSDSGSQPMTTSCHSCGEGIQLVYNGEIYNYRELKSELAKKGHTFDSQSDTEVIIHAYAEYGIEAFNKLNGIFSLALYDGRPKTFSNLISPKDLIIVRGPIGVKPLYYTDNTRYFSFASELKTLLLDQELSRELDLDALNDYLTYLWCPAPRTPLKAVKKLEPGFFLVVRGGLIVKNKRYYDLPLKRKEEIRPSRVKDLIAETKYKVETAIRRQMVSDVPIGAFLSGGLDSSSIVACMKKIDPDRDIDCYTINFLGKNNEGFASDYPFAQKVASHLGVKLNTVNIASDIYKHLPKMIYHLDEPQADIAPINAYLIAEQAKKEGYKVLMSGAGGDDIFTGYRRHYALSQEKYWQWLPSIALKGLEKTAKIIPTGNNPLFRRFSKLFSTCSGSSDERLVSFFDWASDETRAELFGKNKIGNNTLLKNLNNIGNREKISRLNQMLYLECKHFLSDHNLNYTDKMTMSHGIETRVPLLDLDLISHAFGLPDELKQKGKIGKYIFKKSMESYLPKDVIYRPKTGFGAPVREWINADMKPMLDEILGEKSTKKRGIFNYEAIKKLRLSNAMGKKDASYTILALCNIEIWCRTFVDQKIPSPIEI